MSNKINIRFASKEERQQLIKNSSYYNRLTQMDIDWRAKKQNASLAELITMAQNNVLDFTEEDKDLVIQAVMFIENRLDKFDCQLPLPPEIIFVNTTMEDEGNAGAYTSGNMIVLNESCIVESYIEELIAHELFHCITRHSPEFRQKMYSLIGFTVMHPTSGRRWVVTINAAEECLAVNFSSAIVNGPDMLYETPQLIEFILNTLARTKQ